MANNNDKQELQNCCGFCLSGEWMYQCVLRDVHTVVVSLCGMGDGYVCALMSVNMVIVYLCGTPLGAWFQ